MAVEFGPKNFPDLVDHTIACPINWRFAGAQGSADVNFEHFREFHFPHDDVDGAVLDLDGTLVNSEATLVNSVVLAAQELVRNALSDPTFCFSEPQVARVVGCCGVADSEMSFKLHSFLSSSGLIRNGSAGITPEQFGVNLALERRTMIDRAKSAGELRPMPGAVEFMEKLFEAVNGRVALYTGSPKAYAQLTIEAIGIPHLLPEKLRTYGDDVPLGHGKPGRYGFDRARELLDLPAERCVAFGDRPGDMGGAINAGFRMAVVVPEDMNFLRFACPQHGMPKYAAETPDTPVLPHVTSRFVMLGGLDRVKFKNGAS